MESILDRYLEQKKLYEQNGFNFENVEDLVIRNAVSGNIQDLPGHPNITSLEISNVKIATFRGMNVFERVQVLDASSNNLREADFEQLRTSCPSLTTLTLNYNPLNRSNHSPPRVPQSGFFDNPLHTYR
ncbi:Leucine Rich repeat-containing domain protein [Caenorhabditis elegans]|uniref:Leucine Rich repeat-containing domain protein n=1 Tax=Caenorhabditis elegans TaxID=6239 RepID=C6KRN9_CAEEL|nr:Leucine Rich repeat-containing domain protein [Caenorhabditis elegans]CAZ65533.1 Leucine Rich repeat-containing domain protein [Caenorhabditis elegans]|eukprot:NP_001252210.1 Uncharacterized protein CELE_W09C5.12 [Caenorhabditis elegans]